MANYEERTDRFTAVEDFGGYTVRDNNGDKIGKVDDLFLDENDQPEYYGVKMGFFGTSSTLIPADICTTDESRGFIEVSQPKSYVKDGPAFDDDREITPEHENEVRSYYGLSASNGSEQRGSYGDYYGEQQDTEGFDTSYHGGDHDAAATDRTGADDEGRSSYGDPQDREGFDTSYHGGGHASTTGHADEERGSYGDEETGEHSGAGTTGSETAGTVGSGMSMGDTESGEFREHDRNVEGTSQPGSDLEDQDELRVQRSEEELRAGTRERDAGSMKIRKRVRSERERLEVPVKHEEVSVERVPVEGEATEAQIGEDEVSMPVTEEEVVTDKRAVAKEEIRVRKDAVRDTEVVEDDVRKEEVDVEDATERGIRDNGEQSSLDAEGSQDTERGGSRGKKKQRR